MYFAVDIENQIVKNEEGDTFSASAFKTIIERNAAKDKFFDMTQMTSRFIGFGYDWEKLNDFYKAGSH